MVGTTESLRKWTKARYLGELPLLAADSCSLSMVVAANNELGLNSVQRLGFANIEEAFALPIFPRCYLV